MEKNRAFIYFIIHKSKNHFYHKVDEFCNRYINTENKQNYIEDYRKCIRLRQNYIENQR